MTTTNLITISDDDLISNYVKAASSYGKALTKGDHKVVNKQHELLTNIYDELRGRGLKAQRLLITYLDAPDIGVRSCAATHALDFEPEKGEVVLEKIIQLGGVLGLTAGIVLEEWRKGKLHF